VTDYHITVVQGRGPGDGRLPNGPRRISGLKAALLTLLLTSVLVGFVLAALLLGSLVAAGILIVVAIAIVVALIRSGFRRLTRL
jgi:ABC-type arginine/histidine transport system permease subunit